LYANRLSLMTIPARLHFCWIGGNLPWAYVFAILSAAERSELPEIILHHTDILEDGDKLRALKYASRVRLSQIRPENYLAQTGKALGLGDELVVLYRKLEKPVMRADILRAAILYSEGGIYMDLDTITVASLLPLIGTRDFVGLEFIVWPRFVRLSRSPALWARHLTLDLLRKLLRRMPHGWRVFKRVAKFYVRSVNNAVMGAEANSRFFSGYLHAMLRLPRERQTRLYGLGPRLLQEVVDQYAHQDLTIQDPQVFYPLPPEISEHWFRIGKSVALNDVLSADTRVVHWYASVRTEHLVARITPKYVLENRARQLYSALVYSCIGKVLQSYNQPQRY